MMRLLKRRSGRKKLEREASRWLIQMRKGSPPPHMRTELLDEPLVVPKVIKQYTRKKKVSEPVNTLSGPAGGAPVCSDQNVSKTDVDNYIKIEEENNHDFNIPKEVKDHVKMEEPNIAMKEENLVNIKQEQLTEIEILITDNAQTSGPSKVKDIEIDEENLSELMSCDTNVKEGQKEKPKRRVELTVKLEKTDDYEDMDPDRKNTADCHSEVGEAVRKKPKTECDSHRTSDKMDECKNIELEVMSEASVTGHTFHSQNKTLLTEEINIKEEIISDNDDNEITVTSNVKEEPADDLVTGGEQAQVTGITSGSQSVVTRGSGVVLKTYGKKPSMIPVKNCYLLAVNVAPGMSDVHRKAEALLAAKAEQKMVDPKDLAGLTVVAKTQIFGCDMCGKDFFSKIGLGRHMSSAHSVATRFVCHCGDRFTHNFLLLAHMKTHAGTITCDMCPKRFKTTTKYSYHLNTHLKERFFSCPICVRRYTV